MGVNINCKFYNRYAQCNHPEQRVVFWFFKRECILLRNTCGVCRLQEKYLRPKIGRSLRERPKSIPRAKV